jgi:hypothetical protein
MKQLFVMLALVVGACTAIAQENNNETAVPPVPLPGITIRDTHDADL